MRGNNSIECPVLVKRMFTVHSSQFTVDVATNESILNTYAVLRGYLSPMVHCLLPKEVFL
jgi:hypothetical protein